jgi:hypothetical protein
MKPYRVLMHPLAYDKAETYLADLKSQGLARAGAYLRKRLQGQRLFDLSTEAFLEHLVATKRPQIFAESAVQGEGSDWTATELSILGDIGFAVPVSVYDNGRHHRPDVHEPPFSATLLFIPGALLRNGCRQIPADWNEVTANGAIDPKAYAALYERRLLPLLIYANDQAAAVGKQALITVPGLGCGQFAGPFQGQLGEHLKSALMTLLAKQAGRLPSVRAVYYDPYNECENERHEYGRRHVPARQTSDPGQSPEAPTLSPHCLSEQDDDFSECCLFSVVAWDHVSWPGNDFFIGSRATDDGVKAAATDSMYALTGVEGRYDPRACQYNPPAGFRTWREVVAHGGCRLRVEGHLSVLSAM